MDSRQAKMDTQVGVVVIMRASWWDLSFSLDTAQFRCASDFLHLVRVEAKVVLTWLLY